MIWVLGYVIGLVFSAGYFYKVAQEPPKQEADVVAGCALLWPIAWLAALGMAAARWTRSV